MIDKVVKYAIQIAVLVCIVVGGIFLYQKLSDRNAGEELGRLREKVRADSVTNDTLTLKLARSSDSLAIAQALARGATERWRDAIAQIPRMTPLPRTAPASDTVKQVKAAFNRCVQLGDSLATAVEGLQSGCSLYKADAEKRITGLMQANANLDSLARAKRPQKRWHLGPSAGFGYTIVPAGQTDPGKDFQLERRLFVGVSITRSIFSW